LKTDEFNKKITKINARNTIYGVSFND